MLRELIEDGLFDICNEVVDWEEAVRRSIRPLVRHGDVEPEYADVIIRNVRRFGPYIAVAPDIALPHAEDELHVLRSSSCFVKFNHPVSFGTDEMNGEEKTASLFFALSSEDEMRHLKNLRGLTEECLRNRPLIERLCAAQTKEEILKAIAE